MRKNGDGLPRQIAPRKIEGSVSVVIPVCNEEGSINELYRRLSVVLDGLGLPWEIIFVEDSSTDNTISCIKALGEKDDRVKALFLTRSFGHHMAVTAGLDHARGDHIVMMDGDLQHRPEDIPRLFEEYSRGYEIVYGRRVVKQGWLKQKGSDVLNYLSNLLSDSRININSGMFRLISRNVKEDLCRMREVGRFITGMMSWLGYPTATVPVEENKRESGKTKYSFFRLMSLFVYGIISFSTKPLIFSTYLGFLIASITFVWGSAYLIYSLVNGTSIPGYASLILAVFFLGGLILFVLGIVGHYLAVVYTQIQGRPLYIVKHRLNLQKMQ